MTEALLLAITAAAALGAARATGIPSVPALVVAGVLLGRIESLLPGLEPPDVQNPLPQLALAFLVFAAGLELDPRRIGAQRKAAIRVGLTQFAAVGLLGFGVALLFGLDRIAGAYIGLGLAASSTIVGVRILVERRQVFEPFGRLVLGVLLIQDLLMILSLAALSGSEHGAWGLLSGVGAAAAMVAMVFLVVRPVAPRAFAKLSLDPESTLLAAISAPFAFAAVAWYLGLPIVVGAFLAGVALSGFPIGATIRNPLHSLGTFFAAIFFVALGASVDLPSAQAIAIAAVGLAIVLFGTPIAVLIAARRTNLSRRGAVEAGLLLSQCGELTLVLAVIGLGNGHLSEDLFSALSLVTVASMMLTPLLATDRQAWRLSGWLPRPAAAPLPPMAGHVVLVGCSGNSSVLLDLLLLSGTPLVVIDRDAAIVSRLREREVPAICGEGSAPEILEAAHARAAAAVVSTMRRIEDNARLLRHLRPGGEGPRVFARVFDDEDRDALAALGATVVSEAEVAAEEAALAASVAAKAPS